MKTIVISMHCVCAMFILTFLNFTSQAQVVDFENLSGGAYVDYNDVFQTNDSSCATVSFGLGVEENTTAPFVVQTSEQMRIASVGGNKEAFKAGFTAASPNCISGTSDHDIVDPNLGMGCNFLTDDNVLNALSTMRPVIIDYSHGVTQTGAFILDVDDTEAWRVMAFEQVGGSFVLRETIILDVNSPGGGDFSAVPFQFDFTTGPNVGFEIDRVVMVYVGIKDNNIGFAFDNFSVCSLPVSCCGTGPSVFNYDFEGGSAPYSGFTSTYGWSELADGLRPGTRRRSTPNTAEQFCDEFASVLPVGSCERDGSRFILYNGLTNGNGMGTLFETTESLAQNEDYTFCFNAKWLKTCCFNFDAPKITIEILQGSNPIYTRQFDVNTGDGGCDWATISTGVLNLNSGTHTFRILLDQTTFQDGNDIALDNIQLREYGGSCQSGGSGDPVEDPEPELRTEGKNGITDDSKRSSFLDDDDHKFSVNIFPNPNDGRFSINLKGDLKEGSTFIIKVYNILGTQILSHKETINSDRNEKRVDFSIQEKGVHSIMISNSENDNVLQKEIIIN